MRRVQLPCCSRCVTQIDRYRFAVFLCFSHRRPKQGTHAVALTHSLRKFRGFHRVKNKIQNTRFSASNKSAYLSFLYTESEKSTTHTQFARHARASETNDTSTHARTPHTHAPQERHECLLSRCGLHCRFLLGASALCLLMTLLKLFVRRLKRLSAYCNGIIMQ